MSPNQSVPGTATSRLHQLTMLIQWRLVPVPDLYLRWVVEVLPPSESEHDILCENTISIN